MTDQEIRIAVAESCGWKFTTETCSLGKITHATKPGCGTDNVPDYPNDLNAMRSARKCLRTRQQRAQFAEHLISQIGDGEDTDWYTLVDAPPREQSIALLKVFGKWKD